MALPAERSFAQEKLVDQRAATMMVHPPPGRRRRVLSEAAVEDGASRLRLLAATEAGTFPERVLLLDEPGDRYSDVVAALAPAVEVLAAAGRCRTPPRVA